MSQPSTPFSGASTDAFLPSMEENDFIQAQLEELFQSNESDQPLFSTNNSKVLDELDFTVDTASLAHTGSSNVSTTSTPDFSNYSFGQQSSTYPTPGPNSPHPYPLELQQPYQSNATPSIQTYGQHPVPIRSHTNNTFLRPAQIQQSYSRRRSLSHGDVDRIVATNTLAPNPTFVRLQAPQARSTTPEDKRRSRAYPTHGSSASQGPGPTGRPLKPTSTPYVWQGIPVVGGMMSTPIGIPLSELLDIEEAMFSRHDATYNQHGTGVGTTGLPMDYTSPEGPIIRHMTHPAELARSRQIIEIGAMAVVNRSKLNPRFEKREAGKRNHQGALNKLDDVERHLKQDNGNTGDALRGCAMIREALAKKIELENIVSAAGGEVDDHLEAPSKVFSEVDCDMYDTSNDGNELMALLM